MSRSRRKTPIFGHTTARSEADDKERIAARRSQLQPERKALQARLLAKWRSK